MKDRNMQKNFIEKLLSLRKLLESRYPQEYMQDLDKIMSRLAHYHYNKQKYILLGTDKELYNFLIENSYNPFTVYRWLLLERLPDDIKFQIKERKTSQKKAVSEGFTRRHETINDLTQSVREAGLILIRRM